jgi:tetratricopeptide (TPR) repeat protein
MVHHVRGGEGSSHYAKPAALEEQVMLKPISKMRDRIEVARDESDVVLFYDLMKLGELIVKIATAGLVAAVPDDRERYRYRLLHGLVRANGVGDWSRAAEAVTRPPIVERLTPAAREERNQLTQKNKAGTWQCEALSLLDECFAHLSVAKPDGSSTGLQWFHNFATLRNKTPVGHGAQLSTALSRACPSLEKSINLFIENFRVFRRPWAYISTSQSGKYRVSRITTEIDGFEALSTENQLATRYTDGVYVYFDEPMLVELVFSDKDVLNFYLPNGNFNGNKREPTFEVISYDSGATDEQDASPYMAAPVELPRSETTGEELHVVGASYTNIPPSRPGYVPRQKLEEDLRQKLTNSRHEVVTLAGRGGIGKTSLALSVLHKIADQGAFEYIVWFSARDVDLRDTGPKQVTQDVLTVQDMAKEFVRLTEPPERHSKGFDPLTHLCSALEKGVDGKPSLLVFDNFETVEGKREVYEIIDSFIRSPNKALITTRERGFTGDYAIEVGGMTNDEGQKLIDRTAIDLNISGALLTQEYRRQLLLESEGHPYVIKILLGRVKRTGEAKKPDRIMAGEEQILDALFERTYNETLSSQARRVFLNLSNWRSVVPQLALEAVLLRDAENEDDDRIRVGAAVDELYESSFVDIKESPAPEKERFVFVPLTAALFGRRVLPVSPLKNTVQADLDLLHKFGPTQQTDIPRGIKPKVESLFRNVQSERDALTKYLPILEVVARRYPPAWRHMVALYERSSANGGPANAKRTVEQYLQLPARRGDEREREEAWRKLAELRRQTGDFVGEVNALIEMSRLPNCPIEDITYTARRFLNSLNKERDVWSRSEKLALIEELAERMESRRAELYPNDFGRLAWLYLNKGDTDKAERATRQGLRRDENNKYLRDLAEKRLNIWL